jgi:hypothetical protein
MAQDTLAQAKERYQDAQDAVSDQNARFREDLKFSNPACPEQWDDYAKTARRGRPMLTLDRTNQFISQIVNDARQNKPSIQVLPADSQGDPAVAQQLNGIIRHIEYTSRAGIAYDCAIELSARVGLGWLRVLPRVVRPETNEQEIIVQRVHDPMSICLDPNSVEPDGSDAMYGFAETVMTERAFERAYPKAKKLSWESEGDEWFGQDSIRIAEYFKVVEKEENRIAIDGPDGGRMTVGEDEYWQLAKQIGYSPPVQDQFIAKKRTVRWCKMTGAEILEETDFPADWVPLIPVLGYELWVGGKRYLCGMVRRMRDGQRLHNYEASAQTEAMMAQPKAPFILDRRSIDGHEDEWEALNSGNPAYLSYEGVDDAGNPLPPPIRLSPPAFPAGFVNGETRGAQEMQASVGMHKTSLGQQSNAVSGRAKLADLRESDTANFHYIDNLRRSMEHMGRIIVSMIPRIYDTRRQAKILGEDGEQSQVDVDPTMEQAVKKQGGKVIAINPNVGAYDVRVKIGPSYTSMRTEASQRLVEISQGNPALGAALAPLLVKLNDMPESDKISKVAIALLPPNVQQVYAEDENDDIPPAVKAQLTAQGEQMQQMAGAMEQASSVIQDLQGQVDEKNTAVQEQAKAAMAEIKAAQAGLQAQADEIDAKKELFERDVRIAQLELKLQQQTQQAALAKQEQAVMSKPESPKDESGRGSDEAMAQTVSQSQEAIAAALQQTTQAIAQLQQLTVNVLEGLDEVAEIVAAPREIVLQRDESGAAIGARSTVQLSEGQS